MALCNFTIYKDPNTFELAPLTDQNKNQYITKVAEWVFDVLVRESFAAFEQG